VELTGITQEEVDTKGLSPAEALEKFSTWTRGLPLYSWGLFDKEALEETAKLNGIQQFFTWEVQSIRDVFKRAGVPAENYMSSTIVEAFGEKPVRRAHNGLNDARSILDGLRLLSKRQSTQKI
jgi:inhibitor of KinA sporulation pathway (predicted exonuclease)